MEQAMMHRRWRISVLTCALLSLADKGYASSLESNNGDLSFNFNGAATLGLLISGFVIFLGYKLLANGRNTAKSTRSNLRVGMKTFNLTLSGATPGLVLAALGCVGMVASLFAFWH
jgi:hypothetical protein